MFTDEHRHVGMMEYVVTNAAQERASERSFTSGATDNKEGFLFVGHRYDYLPWFTRYTLHFTSNLKI